MLATSLHVSPVVRPVHAAVGATVLIVLIAFGLLSIPNQGSALEDVFTPEHISFLAMYDSSRQGTVHKLLLASVALFSMLGFMMYGGSFPLTDPRPSRAVAHLSGALRPYALLFIIAAFVLDWYLGGSGNVLLDSAPLSDLMGRLDRSAEAVWGRSMRVLDWEAKAHPGIFTAIASIAVLMAACTLAVRSLRHRLFAFASSAGQSLGRPSGAGQRLILAALLIMLTLRHPTDGAVLAAGVLAAAGAYKVSQRMRLRGWQRLVACALLAYMIFLMLPGMLEPLVPTAATRDTPSGNPLSYVEIHYSVVVGPADRLALGRELYAGADPHYGIMLPILVGAAEHQFGMWTFGSHIRLVQWLQIIFLVLTCAGYWIYTRGRIVQAAIPLLLLLPWIHNNQLAILYPNQSAWRFLGLPIGVLALLEMRNRPTQRCAVLLGAVAAVLVILNVETGLAMACGFVLFIALRADDLKLLTLVRLALRFCLAAAATAAMTVVLLAFVQNYAVTFSPSFFDGLFRMINTFGRGYAGLQMKFDAVALLIFAHAIFLVVHACMLRAHGSLSFGRSVRAAIAAMILVWGAYYFNRPHPWNLWSYLFLYGFVLAPYLDPRRWSPHARSVMSAAPSRLLAVQLLAVVLVMGPLLISSNVAAALKVAGGVPLIAPIHPLDGRLVSGVWLPTRLAETLETKAAYLKSQRDEAPAYFTSSSYLMPLISKVDNHLAIMDTFAESPTNAAVDLLTASTLRAGPRTILFDDPAANLADSEPQREFFRRLQASLGASYHYLRTTDGWEIWARTGDGTAALRSSSPPAPSS